MKEGAERLIQADTLYRKGEKMSFKEFLAKFVETTKKEIKALASSSFENSEKKEKLDLKITEAVELMLSKTNLNIFVIFVLKKFILPNVSELTQLIYDLLKSKIKGVTSEAEEV